MQLVQSDLNDINTIAHHEPALCAELLIEVHGERFAYAGQAIGGNSRCALIRTSAPLGIGAEVTLHVLKTGRSAPGWIVSETRELSHFRVDLTNSENLWDGLHIEQSVHTHFGLEALPR